MPTVTRRYDQGRVDSRDRSELLPGEMQQATGIFYKPGDTRAHKIDGRSEFGDTSSGVKIDGVYLAEFDTATDQILALSNSVLYKSPATAGSFTDSLATVTGSSLSGAHANDRHYLCTGNENVVFESDGSTRSMGMKAPVEGLTHTTLSTGVSARPTADDGNFTGGSKMYDGDLSTFGFKAHAAAGATTTVLSSWAANATVADRYVVVWWELRSAGAGGSGTGSGLLDWIFPGDGGGDSVPGFKVKVKFEITEDASATTPTWTTVKESTYFRAIPLHRSVFQYDTGNTGAQASTELQLRVTITYQDGTKRAALGIRDTKLHTGSSATLFSATNIKYTVTEYDEVRGIEGPPSDILDTGVITDKNAVLLALPSAKVNSNATHYYIYRTADEGTDTQLGWIAEVRITTPQEKYLDDFTNYTSTTQPTGKPLNWLQITANGTTTHYVRDTPPPALSRIAYFKGSLAGISSLNERELYYSIPGLPESWPEINLFSSFPLPRNDKLVDLKQVGGSLIIAMQEAMARLDELPRSISGTFIASDVVPIAGAPGCVGPYAMTVVNHNGSSHVAWISHEDGVLVTDGHKWDTISRDLDWSQFDGFDKSAWVLRWMPHIRALALYYSSTSGGGNDRYLLLHLDASHLKNGRDAKIAGEHYGATADMTNGVVSNTTRVFEGHWSDGKVYLNLDSSTGADDSDAYLGDASDTSPLIITGRRAYEDWSSYSAIDGKLYHTDFGSGQSASVALTMGRDEGSGNGAKTKTVSLASQRGTQFEISLHGEWLEETITHTGTGRGALRDMSVRALGTGAEGTQKVAT